MRALLYILFVAAVLSCNQNNPAPNQGNVGTDAKYLNASIDGVAWTAEELTNGCIQYVSYYTVEDYPNDILHIGYRAGFDQEPNTSTISYTLNGDLRVCFSGFQHDMSDYYGGVNVFHNSLATMGTAYYIDSSSVSGPEVSYRDASNEYWSTRYGDQSSSTFNITNNVAMPQGSLTFGSRLIKGTFSCILYKQSDPAQSKQVTGGNFYVRIDQDV